MLLSVLARHSAETSQQVQQYAQNVHQGQPGMPAWLFFSIVVVLAIVAYRTFVPSGHVGDKSRRDS
jgi:hypothetical protein